MKSCHLLESSQSVITIFLQKRKKKAEQRYQLVLLNIFNWSDDGREKNGRYYPPVGLAATRKMGENVDNWEEDG